MKKTLFVLMAFSAVFATSSCSKDDSPEPVKAQLMVVHASPDAPNVDVSANGTIVKSNLAYPSNTGYLSVGAGAYNLKVAPTGTTTYVIDANATLESGKAYSVFAVDKVANIKAAVVADNLTAPANGKAHVRFLHFSPDAPPVDIAIASGGAVIFGNRAFNDQAATPAYQSFTPVDAGTLNLEVRLAGTATVALPLGNITFQAGKIYTVFAKGLLAGTGAQALGAEIIVNNP